MNTALVEEFVLNKPSIKWFSSHLAGREFTLSPSISVAHELAAVLPQSDFVATVRLLGVNSCASHTVSIVGRSDNVRFVLKPRPTDVHEKENAHKHTYIPFR